MLLIKDEILYQETEDGLVEVDFADSRNKAIKTAYLRTLYDNCFEPFANGKYRLSDDESLILVESI